METLANLVRMAHLDLKASEDVTGKMADLDVKEKLENLVPEVPLGLKVQQENQVIQEIQDHKDLLVSLAHLVNQVYRV